MGLVVGALLLWIAGCGPTVQPPPQGLDFPSPHQWDIALGRLVEVERHDQPLQDGDVPATVTFSGALQHFGVERVRFSYWLRGDCLDDLVVGDEVLVFGAPFIYVDCADLAVRSAMERQGRDFDALAHERGFTTNPIGLR